MSCAMEEECKRLGIVCLAIAASASRAGTSSQLISLKNVVQMAMDMRRLINWSSRGIGAFLNRLLIVKSKMLCTGMMRILPGLELVIVEPESLFSKIMGSMPP